MKPFLLHILIFILTLNLSAQRFDGGIIAGFTGSQVDGDKFAGFNKLGASFGVFTHTHLTSGVITQFELKYSGRGAWGNKGTKENPSIYQLTLQYVEMPVAIILPVTKHFYPETGIAPSFLAGQRLYDSGGEISTTLINPPFRKFDFDYLIGLNYSLTDNLIFNMRYEYSIFPIRKRNIGGYYYGWLAEKLGYNEGDYNNFITLALYWHISKKE